MGKKRSREYMDRRNARKRAARAAAKLGKAGMSGLILSWEIAGTDLVRNFSVERRRYFEVEYPTRVEIGEGVA